MKKNFILNNKKMVLYKISNATIIMTQGDAQSNIGKYTLHIIKYELKIIITRYLRGPSKPLYKEMKKLLRTLQKNSSFPFGYTICHPVDTFDPNTGYEYAKHNYYLQEEQTMTTPTPELTTFTSMMQNEFDAQFPEKGNSYKDLTPEELFNLLTQKWHAIADTDFTPDSSPAIIKNCIHIANFCMMITHNLEEEDL